MKIQRESGNIMMLVLIFLAVMGISLYTLLEHVILQKRQTVKTNNILELKFALDSTVDFVLFGVKQKYCFSDILMNEANCNRKHDGSVERLIMPMEQVSFLLTAGVVKPSEAESLRLDKISRDVEIALVTSVHPLYNVFRTLQLQKELADIQYLHVEIERNDSVFLPRSGNEVYLTVTVSFSKTKSSSTVISVGNERLQVVSNVVIYPREVGSFALLVPQNLYLGSGAASPSFGDTYFAGVLGTKEQFINKPGLVFLSPVFVNRDIVLNSSSYTPVTFSDRVYLGEGRVMMSGGEPFRPASNGGIGTRYWRDVSSFGGFLRGLENDGAQDAGLNAFVGKLKGSGTQPSGNDMARCIDHNLGQADLRKVLDSSLRIELNDSNQARYRYILGLTKSEFEGQRLSDRVTKVNWDARTDLDVDRDYKKMIMNVKIKVGDRSVEFPMSKETEFTSPVPVGSKAYQDKLNDNISAAESAVNSANKGLKNLQKDVDAAEDAVDEAEKALREAKTSLEAGGENAASVEDIAAKEKAVEERKKNLAQKEKALKDQQQEISKKEEELAAAEAALKTYKYKVDNPPEITIKTEPFIRDSGRSSNAKVYFDVTVKNPNHMLDEKGEVVSPVFSVKAFDSGYIDGEFIGNRRDGWRNNRPEEEKDNRGSKFSENDKLNRELNFIVDPNTGVVSAPAGDSRNSGGFEDMGDYCRDIRGAADSQAFGMADANISFATSTRTSWNFAGTGSETGTTKTDPLVSSITFDGNNAAAGKGVTSFQVRSIVGTCTIKAGANFVTGFFSCNKLVIEARTAPLRIIGTFIAGNVSMDPSAYDAGIIWSSIYHPQAVAELRSEGILKKTSTNGTCLATSSAPIWNPIPSIQDVADRMSCNVISLRAKADPFQWTSVDPDCGLLKGMSNTSCKRRLVRFFVVEQSREGAR